MILTIIINGLFLIALICAVVAVIRRGSRTEHVAFVVGITVAFILAGAGHVVAMGLFHLSKTQYFVFGRVTLYLWPSVLALLDVDPIIDYSFQRLLVYVILMVVNGVMYAGVAAGIRKIWNIAKRAGTSR